MGTADAAAGGMGSLADETTRADEAAKGALASFDQLNVLQQKTPATAGGGGGSGGMKMIQVDVTGPAADAGSQASFGDDDDIPF